MNWKLKSLVRKNEAWAGCWPKETTNGAEDLNAYEPLWQYPSKLTSWLAKDEVNPEIPRVQDQRRSRKRRITPCLPKRDRTGNHLWSMEKGSRLEGITK